MAMGGSSTAAAAYYLRSLLLLSLEGLFAIAPYHDDGQEGADDGGKEDDEDDGDADGPDAGQEERVQQVVLVDKGLGGGRGSAWCEGGRGKGEGRPDHEECPDGVVDEDGRGSHKHAEADETVELEQARSVGGTRSRTG